MLLNVCSKTKLYCHEKMGEKYTCPQCPYLHVNNYAKGRIYTCNFSLKKTDTLGFTSLHYRTHVAETVSASSPTCSTHWPSYHSLSSQQHTCLLAISPLTCIDIIQAETHYEFQKQLPILQTLKTPLCPVPQISKN